MNTNGVLSKHWLHVSLHFLVDALLFALAIATGMLLRFGDEAENSLWIHWPYLILAAAAFSAATYICGLYSTHSIGKGIYHRGVVLAGLIVLAALVLIGATYGSFARPIGRGVVLLGGVTAYCLVMVHHMFLLHGLRSSSERVVYLVSSAFDEAETRLFEKFGAKNLVLVGLVTACGYRPTGNTPVLGSIEELAGLVRREKIDRVLCTTNNLSNVALTRHFCQLRYSGVTVMPLVILCEEVEQYVPLELITHEWLLNASGEPQLLYIRKVKRLFDILASVTGLVLGAPLVALAAVMIKLTSPGPIFYRQVRSGRFGRAITMIKLRTMVVDAEKEGVQWSGKNDTRVHPVGWFLRKYRIDEIPQFWQVLCGHMSFVGPRPERPEIIAELDKAIPFYRERLMVQPGITGWAQVSCGYGASVLDARHKLEYDLYYMKHMSLFLDVFILLDTVRIILSGGARVESGRRRFEPDSVLAWQQLKEPDIVPVAVPVA